MIAGEPACVLLEARVDFGIIGSASSVALPCFAAGWCHGKARGVHDRHGCDANGHPCGAGLGKQMFEILLVEDNPADVLMVEEAFEGTPLQKKLQVAKNGDDAIAYLQRQGKHANATRPDLVILDLNLPGTSGIEVLEAIKGDASLKRIPVVILTSSQSNSDRLACYNLHANAFMTKVMDFRELQSMVTTTCEYWFSIVKLPPH